MNDNSGKAWVLISAGDKRIWEGNDGYQDDTGRSYDYDGFVPNNKNVQSGDIIFLSNKEQIFGVAVIEHIESWQGTRMFNRCPHCDSSHLQSRVVKSPKYRCNRCHEEFDLPRLEEQKCTKYRAHYQKTFTSVVKPLHPDSVYINKGTQQSMRQVRRADAVKILDSWGAHLAVPEKTRTPSDSRLQIPGSKNQTMPTGVRSAVMQAGSGTDTAYRPSQMTEVETLIGISGSTQNESEIDRKAQDSSRTDLYNRVQRAITEIESAIFELLRMYPGGLTNAEIGRYLGIYFGHDGHEGHVSRSILALMEKKGVVQQPIRRGPWQLR